ncbi:MAG: ABC transporter substrate-binding protein [Lautropia sp.]
MLAARFFRRIAIGLSALAVAGAALAQGRPAYTVGATATGVPFTFLDVKTNSIQGMMVDTAQAVGKAAGFDVSIQQTVFAALIPSLTSKKIDIISAGMLKTPARAEVVDFSAPVYSYGEGLIVKLDDSKAYASLDDLKGEVVGAQVGTVFLDMLNKKGGFKEVRSYDSIADMMRDIALGRVKAGLGDQPIVAYQLSKGANSSVKLAKAYKPTNVGDVCLVVRKGDAETLARVNQGIAAIKADGTLANIIGKWNL